MGIYLSWLLWCGVVFASVFCCCGKCFAVCCGVCEAVGSLKSQQNVRVARGLLCLEMIPGGLATFLKGSLRGTLLRRRGEPSGRVVPEDVAFRRLSCLVSYSPLGPTLDKNSATAKSLPQATQLPCDTPKRSKNIPCLAEPRPSPCGAQRHR